MKKFDDFIELNKFLELNKNSAELTLLSNLYSLHEKNKSLDKFKEQVAHLESIGQLTTKNINEFLRDKNIKIELEKVNIITESGCGSGGYGSYSSGCGSSEPEYYLENSDTKIRLKSKEELDEVVRQFNLKRRSKYSDTTYTLPKDLGEISEIIKFIELLRNADKYNL